MSSPLCWWGLTSTCFVFSFLSLYAMNVILLLNSQHLAHEDERDDLRMTASQLLNLLAEALGQVGVVFKLYILLHCAFTLY